MIENACGDKQNSGKSDKPEDTVNNQELDAYNFIDKYVNSKKNTGTQDGTTKSTHSEARKNETKYNKRKCWFFMKGICRYCESCRYRHEKYPRSDFGQRWNRGQNMRSRKTDTNRKKGNSNTSKMEHRLSYMDATKM